MSILRELLDAEIGTFKDGRKAFWDDLRSRPDMNPGMLLILRRHPLRVNDQMDQWFLSLVQSDRSDAGVQKFDSAIAKLKDKFPQHRNLLVFDGGDGQPLQCNLRLLFHPEAYPNINGRIVEAL